MTLYRMQDLQVQRTCGDESQATERLKLMLVCSALDTASKACEEFVSQRYVLAAKLYVCVFGAKATLPHKMHSKFVPDYQLCLTQGVLACRMFG